MGAGPSAQYTADTIKGEQLRHANRTMEGTIGKAFEKCIGDIEPREGMKTALTMDERSCVEEYSLLFTHFTKASFNQFQQQFNNLQREGQERAQREMMAQQSRSDIKKMRGE